MTVLQWKEEYSVGVPAVDHEHREMIDLINEVCGLLGENSDADQVESYLGDIYATISAHFALEERIMRHAGFEEFETHKDDHERLLDLLRDITDDFINDPVSGSGRLATELDAWFVGHFSTFDARLHGQLDD